VSGLNEQKLFIIAKDMGRLANRLVLFANFIAYAEENGHRVANVMFHRYADLFETTQRDIYCRYPMTTKHSWLHSFPAIAAQIRSARIFCKTVRYASKLNKAVPLFGRKVVTLREVPGRDVTFLNYTRVQNQIAAAKIIFVHDWRFRQPDAVQKHAAKIREYFRPSAVIENSSREIIARIRQKADIVVGVHVRRGDYRIWKNGKFFFEIDQYAAWMRSLAAQFGDRKVTFLVSSDELHHRGEFADLPVEILTGSALDALSALARCDFIFGPPSTFSQWASFYGNAPLLHLWNRNESVSIAKFRVSSLLEIPS
jgi:hypothetical protein